jgi:hypothetical protein
MNTLYPGARLKLTVLVKIRQALFAYVGVNPTVIRSRHRRPFLEISRLVYVQKPFYKLACHVQRKCTFHEIDMSL